VDSRASLDDVGKTNSWAYQDSNSDPSVIQPIASRYTDYTILAPLLYTYLKKTTKLRGFSPQANYTDRATAACRQS
jgi:hypothetical protein